MRISDGSADVCSSDLLGIGKHTIEPRMTARLPACLETMTGQRLQRVGAGEPFEFARIERGATRKVVDIHECFLQARLHDAMPGFDIETTHETQTETDRRVPLCIAFEMAVPAAVLHIDCAHFDTGTPGLGNQHRYRIEAHRLRSEEHTSELQSLI